MKKLFLLLIVLTAGKISAQDNYHFSIWTYTSAGLSGANYTDANLSFSGQVGLGVQVGDWRLKFDRKVNNEFVLFIPEEKINASSILIGYSTQLNNNYPDFLLIGNAGIGYIQSTKRGKVTHRGFFDNHYEMLTYKSTGYLLEVGFEYSFYNFFGISYSMFTNINKHRNFYGMNAGIMIGYF